MTPRIVAIIPTFNEVELLDACVTSLASQEIDRLEIVVVNAGDPLPPDWQGRVTELKVSSDHFWTSCMDAGIRTVRERADFLLFTNADTTFLPGSVGLLLQEAQAKPKTIACSPAYVQVDIQPIELLYSHQSDLGPLLYGKLVRRWHSPNDAPLESFPIELTGGQGVLMPVGLFDHASLDIGNFPHYASDHDLWLQARRLGFELHLVPRAGIVNHRSFNDGAKKQGWIIGRLWGRI
ncbi:MAG: glycosyltransferase family 2 protein, partial [Fimbriimonadaceae bacterium]|nr:glycosyltransferase family 2 protein [Fimbriimonadaceae bacterium]